MKTPVLYFVYEVGQFLSPEAPGVVMNKNHETDMIC